MERRNTKQRHLVLNAVKGRCDHPTAEQIYEEVKEKDHSVSRGTVYRNLSVLAQSGEIKSIGLSQACRFDLRTDKHNHFICSSCGKVCDIDVKYDDSYDNRELENGFLISSHETLFTGLCAECNNKKLQ